MTNRDLFKFPLTALAACATAAVLMTGCASQKTPATADVAVSRAALDNAASAGAAELAPDEMRSAREKMMRANQALKDRDYKLARELADQAQADAKLAQSKANSTKATTAADEINENIRVMREELNRANMQAPQQ
ncbi:DUF4398 domain-containing protein [Janthinobacterium psychrotolerans]|uniref:DUF4398 domain-containing protein n=1 Tax=Janthinobacterium psychrotolerans TaxID=1747903 RepID=A0A1A7C5Z8_9BURK|nr:DUF4398 domain-containing protein [Janthinobacterium psychrotolerans]OBV40185.1 protein of unknown function (DUF4398) [Janthinobacterium psychrotolerans]